MNKNYIKFNVPAGMRDLIYEDCRRCREIESRLSQVYADGGFREVITPALEYLEVFSGEGSTLDYERMYKLIDPSGRLLALRADSTTPIARIAATKLIGNLPAHIYYNQSVFAVQDQNSGRRGEILQSGVEIIGSSGSRSDLLCIITALRAMKALKISYKLELGHVGFYNGIISGLTLDDRDKRSLRKLVNAKNTVSLGRFSGLAKCDLDRIRRLPLLYGGKEVFTEAQQIAAGNAGAIEALDYIKLLYSQLEAAGLAENIIIDFGIVHDIDYYTGAVLRGYIDGVGEHILSGGRYDGLLAGFGYNVPATGFAINVGAVADSRAKNESISEPAAPDILIHYGEDKFTDAVRVMRSAMREGKKCELSCFDELGQSKQYAASRGISEVIEL